MAEYRDPARHTSDDPPHSVVNPTVRRTALRTYLGTIAVFFAVVAAALVYWVNRPEAPRADDPAAAEQPAGTAGVAPEGTDTPGGHDPQPQPESTRAEIEHRGGEAITELGEVIEEGGRGEIGRRVQVDDVEVERIESPALVWVRDGNARVAVVLPAGRTVVAGQEVDIVGVVERAGDGARIRASHVRPSDQRQQ